MAGEGLQAFREQYPQYADMDDTTLATALHAKFYSDIPKQDYFSRLGIQTQPEPSFWSMEYGGDTPTAGGMIMSGAQGALKGSLKTLTFPADVAAFGVNKAAQALGYSEPLGYMGNLIDEATTAVAGGYDPGAAQNSVERGTETVSEFVSAAPLWAKSGAMLAAQTAAPRLQKLGQILATNPGGQMRAAAAAGVGSAAAQEAFPDSMLAQIGIPVLTGSVPAIAEAGGQGLIQALRSRLSSQVAKDAAQNEARAVIEQFTEPNKLVAALKAAEAEQAALPWIERQSENFLPQFKRTAELAQDPGASALEMALRRSVPEVDASIIAQDSAREAARQNIYGALAKKPMQDAEIGQAIRTGLESNLAQVEGKVAELSAKAFKGGENVPTYGAKVSLSNSLKQFTEDGSRTVAPDFMKIVDNFRALPSKVDLKVIQNYRSAFGEWASVSPNASTVEKATARVAKNLRDTLDETVTRLAGENKIPKSQFNAWRKMIDVRTQQGALYESGPVGDVLKKKFRRYEMPGSEVAGSALGTPEDAKQMIAALSRQAPSREALRTAVLQNVYAKSVDPVTSTFNTTRFVRQLQMMGDVNEAILTVPQRKALSLIEADLKSQSSVGSMASRASKGQSITAQAKTNIELLQKSIAADAPSVVDNIHPMLGKIWRLVSQVGNNAETRKQLVNAELAKFVTDPKYAIQLMQQPSVAAMEEILPKLYASMAANIEATTRSVSDLERATAQQSLRGAM